MIRQFGIFLLICISAESVNAQSVKASLQYNQNDNWLNEITVSLDTTSNSRQFFRTEVSASINPDLVFASQFGSNYADFISSYAVNSDNIIIASNSTLWTSNGYGPAIAHSHTLYKYDNNGTPLLSKINPLGKDSYGNDFGIQDCSAKNNFIYVSGTSRPLVSSSAQQPDYLLAKLDLAFNLIKTKTINAFPKKILISPTLNEIYSVEEGANPFWDDSSIVVRDENLEAQKTILVRKAPYKNNLAIPYDSDISSAFLANDGHILLIGFENPSGTTPAQFPQNTSIKVKNINPINSVITEKEITLTSFSNTKTETSSELVIEQAYIYDCVQSTDNCIFILGGLTKTTYKKDVNNNLQYDKTEWSTKICKVNSDFVVQWENQFDDILGSGLSLSSDGQYLLVASTSYVNNPSSIPVGTLMILSQSIGSLKGKYRKIGSYGYEWGRKVFVSGSNTIFMLGDTSSSSIGTSLGGPDDIFLAKFSGYQKKVFVQTSDDLISWDDNWYTPDQSKVDFSWRIQISK